jgi:large subunit ribosomal protein L24
MAKNRKRLKHNSVGVKIMQETNRVKNPRKQRKMLFTAPAHLRHKLMAAPLSKELAASKGVRSLSVRKGDTVRILRGDNKGFEGKVSRVDPRAYRIYVEGLTREKVDGTNIFISVHPSKVQIRTLNLDDRWRKDILARKKKIEKPEREEKVTRKEKPAEEVLKAAKKKPKAKPKKVEEEKREEVPVEEKAAPEIMKEEVAEKEAEKAPAAKKARAKKTAAKKPAAKKEPVPEEKELAKEEVPVEEEKVPAKKVAKPKTAAKKIAASKEAPAKEKSAKKTAVKPRAKRKTSEKSEGGQ